MKIEFGKIPDRELRVLEAELGVRAVQYLQIENSDWAYKMWFMSPRWWWNAETREFVGETRPEMLRFAEGGVR